MDFSCAQAGSRVVVVVHWSALVVTTWVTGPPVAGVYAVSVWLPRMSVTSVGRPYGSYTDVDVVRKVGVPALYSLSLSVRVISPLVGATPGACVS